MTKTRIPPLNIDLLADGTIQLEQDDGSGNVSWIELHPLHVQHIAELVGLVPARSGDYTPPAWVLARRLRVLLDRINELDDRLRMVADAGREDLSIELEFSLATWEMASEFVNELPPRTHQPSPPDTPSGRQDASGQLPLPGARS